MPKVFIITTLQVRWRIQVFTNKLSYSTVVKASERHITNSPPLNILNFPARLNKIERQPESQSYFGKFCPMVTTNTAPYDLFQPLAYCALSI